MPTHDYYQGGLLTSKMSSSPEKSAAYLDVVDIWLVHPLAKSWLSFVNATTNCVSVYWQWFSKVILSPCSLVISLIESCRLLMQCRLRNHRSLVCKDFIRLTDSFMSFRRWNSQTPCNYTLRNVVLNLFDYLPMQFSQSNEPLLILACKGLSLLRMPFISNHDDHLYQLTAFLGECSNQVILSIPQLFQSGSCPNLFEKCCLFKIHKLMR